MLDPIEAQHAASREFDCRLQHVEAQVQEAQAMLEEYEAQRALLEAKIAIQQEMITKYQHKSRLIQLLQKFEALQDTASAVNFLFCTSGASQITDYIEQHVGQ